MCLHFKQFMYNRCWHMSATPDRGVGWIQPIKCRAVMERLAAYHASDDSSGRATGQTPPAPTRPSATDPPTGTVHITRAPEQPFLGRKPPSDALLRWVVHRSVREGLQGGLLLLGAPPAPPPPPPRPRMPGLCRPVWGDLVHQGNVLVYLVDWWCPDCVRRRQAEAEAEARGSRWVRVETPEFVAVVAPDEVGRELSHLPDATDASLARAEEGVDATAEAEPVRTAGEGGPVIVGGRVDEELEVAEEAGRRAWEMHCRETRAP